MTADRLTIPRDEQYAMTARILGCAIEVHRALGPGFLEQVYQKAFILELTANGLECGTEVQVPIHHRGVVIGRHELDLLVEGHVIIELKSVKRLEPVHFAQVRSYLAATSLKIGLLFNFGGYRLETRRVFNAEERDQYLGTRSSRSPRVPAPGVPGFSAAASTPREIRAGGS